MFSSSARLSPSAESEVFRGQRGDFFKLMQSKLEEVSRELYSVSLIDRLQYDQLIDHRQFQSDKKAEELLRFVEQRIKKDSTQFSDFLKSLKKVGLSGMATQLNSKLEDYKCKYKLLVDYHCLLVSAFVSRIDEVRCQLLENKLIDTETAELRSEHPDHEMSSVEKAIALANGVLKSIYEDISKFTILMEYLSKSFGLVLDWPTQESSLGNFVPFLAYSIKKMEEDIHGKVSTILKGMRKATNVMSDYVVSETDSEHDEAEKVDAAEKVDVAENTKNSSIFTDDELKNVVDAVLKATPAEVEANKNITKLTEKLKKSKEIIDSLQEKKRALEDEIRQLYKKDKKNIKELAKKKKELRQIESELKEEKDKSYQYKRKLSFAQRKLKTEQLNNRSSWLKEKTKLIVEKHKDLKKKEKELEDIKSQTKTILQDYLDKIVNL